MNNESRNCFVCRKPMVISYDFAVIENAHTTQRTVHHSTTRTTQRLAGIARLALCQDCLLERLDRFVTCNTTSSGKPKLMKKKLVDECYRLRNKIESKDYSKTLELQMLFFTTLSPFEEMISFVDKNPLWDCYYITLGNFAIQQYAIRGDKVMNAVSSQVRSRIVLELIEAEYALVSLNEQLHSIWVPFEEKIDPSLPDSYFSLFFVEYLDKLVDVGKLSTGLRQQAAELKNLYSNRI